MAIGSRDFDDFYRAELPRLVVLARALCGGAVAEDVAQEAMLAACRRWGVVGELAYPEAWDGTRIAVTDGDRIDQLSADGTTTYAPLGNGTGPLAWVAPPRE